MYKQLKVINRTTLFLVDMKMPIALAKGAVGRVFSFVPEMNRVIFERGNMGIVDPAQGYTSDNADMEISGVFTLGIFPDGHSEFDMTSEAIDKLVSAGILEYVEAETE